MIRQLGLSGRELREVEIYASIKAEQQRSDDGRPKEQPPEVVEHQLLAFAERHNAAIEARAKARQEAQRQGAG